MRKIYIRPRVVIRFGDRRHVETKGSNVDSRRLIDYDTYRKVE